MSLDFKGTGFGSAAAAVKDVRRPEPKMTSKKRSQKSKKRNQYSLKRLKNNLNFFVAHC